ncbi:hypothetical protein Goshw_024105 [Gossypium schwendimanii]|uniref:BHLH domain-containing protein n=1 Tax=Gossypium schwendimanii TaxID=34291 RepID=A0A7J9LY63_GOSSC|nr:hypothetical protein [Gossypium schwendimanii]
MMDDGNLTSNCFSQYYSPELFHDSLFDPNNHETSCVDHCSKVVSQSDNEPSVGEKQSTGGGDSTVVDKLEKGEQVTQNVNPRNRKRKTRNGTTFKTKDAKEGKAKEKKKCNNGKKGEKKSPEEPPSGYIHLEMGSDNPEPLLLGQTQSPNGLKRSGWMNHGTKALVVRRKKISERMKILQCLVPGCEKVTGKALMLDEIINYVQSLQNQVEFLSMKLASVSPMFYDFGVDLEALMVKPERVNSEASTTTPVLPCLQQCNPTQASAFVDSTTATFAPSNNYPFLGASHQGQTPILFSHPQDNGSVLWDVEDQRQKFLNSSGLNDNLCSFH